MDMISFTVGALAASGVWALILALLPTRTKKSSRKVSSEADDYSDFLNY